MKPLLALLLMFPFYLLHLPVLLAQETGGEPGSGETNPCRIYGCDSSGTPYDEDYPWGQDGTEDHPNGFDGKPG